MWKPLQKRTKNKAYKTFIEDGNPTTRDGYASDGEVDGKTRSKSIMQLIEGANSFANLDSPAKKCLEHLELLNRGKGDKPTAAAIASEARKKLVTLTMAFLKWTQHRTKVLLD